MITSQKWIPETRVLIEHKSESEHVNDVKSGVRGLVAPTIRK